MASYFGWVDFAEEDRKKMMDVIHLFNEPDTRDELGIGTIRDAFADYFFPGTSTIQTRARYFLFISWIYNALEDKKVKSKEIAHRLRKEEVKLIKALLSTDDTHGVIGKREKEKLQRLPSNIYWAGLGSWGIRTYSGSQNQYHHYLNTFYIKKKLMVKNDDNESASGFVKHNWHLGLPESPKDFPKYADLILTSEEAHYLQERILSQHRKSLLYFLVSADMFEKVDFFWNLPNTITDSLSETLKKDVQHAHNFSETMLGAALLYNLMLAQMQKNDDLIKNYQMQLNDWIKNISDSHRWKELITWYNDLDGFWTSAALKDAKIPPKTQTFVKMWYKNIFEIKKLILIPENKDARELISHREKQLKRNRARLQNPRALDMWNGSAGNNQLDFRWRTVEKIVQDILNGLKEGET
ncbi:MAG: DUF6361 family protein [Candidatus Eremiobacteraeota bacterium]|nr:DUF6361 family protein [Candidatus Eremiobacteraeota bacterium]